MDTRLKEVSRAFNFWIVIHPAEDVPGTWLAHCLDLDVMSLGRSVDHALQMIREAMEIVIVSDLERGADPLDRRAPDEYWEAKEKIIRYGKFFRNFSKKAMLEHPIDSWFVFQWRCLVGEIRPASQEMERGDWRRSLNPAIWAAAERQMLGGFRDARSAGCH